MDDFHEVLLKDGIVFFCSISKSGKIFDKSDRNPDFCREF